MLAGRARITAIDPEGRNFVDHLGVGDPWNFRTGLLTRSGRSGLEWFRSRGSPFATLREPSTRRSSRG